MNVVTLVMSFTVYDAVQNVDRYRFTVSLNWLPRLKILKLTAYQPRMALQYNNFYSHDCYNDKFTVIVLTEL